MRSRVLVLLLLIPVAAPGYSVLTHEAIIDSSWDVSIKPALLKRYPAATGEELLKAHSYAYGGAIIQDMGYYPFGSHMFSDLLHYVRSGDFVVNLLEESSDLNEYAFALGAVAHYAADGDGHSIATNVAVPILFPKLKTKYGEVVNYEDDPGAHLKVEFGFDVVQVANGRYAPQAYHDFIGFEVSKPVLERAFRQTYGLELKEVFANLDLSINTYRNTVSQLIPKMTKIAWALKKDEILKEEPTRSEKKFVYNLSRASFKKEWGENYEKPSWRARLLAFLFRMVPPIGPFKFLAFRPSTPHTEELFMKSFNLTMDQYRSLLTKERARGEQQQVGEVGITAAFGMTNYNFDTGNPTRLGEYRNADATYQKLVNKLADKQFAGTSLPLQTDILSFYAKTPVSAPISTTGKNLSAKQKKRSEEEVGAEAKLKGNLERLKELRLDPNGESLSPPVSTPSPSHPSGVARFAFQ